MCYVDYLKSSIAIKAMQYFYSLDLGSYFKFLIASSMLQLDEI